MIRLSSLSPRAALSVLLGWVALSTGLISALASHWAAAFFALAMGLVAMVCLRGLLWFSAGAAVVLGALFGLLQVVTAPQPVAVDFAMISDVNYSGIPLGLTLGSLGPALLGVALLLATVPVAGFPGNRFR